VGVAALVLSCALGSNAFGQERVWRFDCGTADSPVATGYQRLTADDMYDGGKGYGWEGAEPIAHATQGIDLTGTHFGGLGWEEYIAENLNSLNRDWVCAETDLAFRVDVPDGTYRVSLTIGDMEKEIGSISVAINGKTVASAVTAWTPGGYRMLHRTPMGWWAAISSTVEVTDGKITVRLSKDQSHYDQEWAEQETWVSPYRLYWWTGAAEKDPPYYFIGYPFVENSLMAIEVVPHVPAPVEAQDDKLSFTRTINSPALHEALKLFNSGQFDASLKALGGANEPEARTASAIVALWLAGRLEIESEADLVPASMESLRECVKLRPEENRVAEILRDAEIFQRALTTHRTRGQTGKNHFIENDKAIGRFWMIREDSPLYYKSQLYIARAAHMLVPYVPTLGTEAEILKKLEKKFPDNRHVKYLLHWTWEPYGDGTQPGDWFMIDYSERVKDAPPWVQATYPAWATLVDWCEWFIKFKQEPEGGVGGGSGDDVEIVGAFGYFGYTGRGISDTLIPGTDKLIEWVYTDTAVDPEIGFCLPIADAEHSAEWTGNTLGMMAQIDYGNPVWVERSMKTAKLMRDLWTDRNKHGLRHFRSNFFGAAGVGSGGQMNDSWINYRAVRPATAVLWYNQNPSIAKLFVELADGWLAAAMSEERGKPRGVIPAQVSFPEGIIGGTDSPNWWTASHPPGSVNYDWYGTHSPQAYKEYLHDLLLTAYEVTREPKYLEPMQLEYELAAAQGNVPEETTGSRLQEVNDTDVQKMEGTWEPYKIGDEPSAPQESVGPQTAPGDPGSVEWVGQNLRDVKGWLTAKRIMEGRSGPLQNDVSKDIIIDYCKKNLSMTQHRWPLMTTEASATDRAAFGGIVTPFLIYTGGRFGGPLLMSSITYDNTTREFAAAVLGTDPQGFRLLYYSLAPEEREIGIVPWELEPGGTYVLRYGLDLDDNEEMDSVLEERRFTFPQRGTPIPLLVKPGRTYLVEVDQVERGRGPTLAPDPGLSARDIRYDSDSGQLLARIHNIGSKAVRNVQVGAYDGDPENGGVLIGREMIPNIEAPIDLEPRAVTIAFPWDPQGELHDVYIVVDPDDAIEDEITTFNNTAHKPLPEEEDLETARPGRLTDSVIRRGRR